MKDEKKIIKKALKDLGVKSGKVKIKVFCGRAIVELNGAYFGTFDFKRGTFVD